MTGRWQRRLIGCQGLYYVVTGLWPLAHLSSFEAVTGPKTDDWLVHMVGILAAAVGAALGSAAVRQRIDPAVLVLSAGSALAFMAIDLWYGLAGRIAPVYLIDGVLQVALLIGLAWTSRGSGSEPYEGAAPRQRANY
jgi:hypothetical protein